MRGNCRRITRVSVTVLSLSHLLQEKITGSPLDGPFESRIIGRASNLPVKWCAVKRGPISWPLWQLITRINTRDACCFHSSSPPPLLTSELPSAGWERRLSLLLQSRLWYTDSNKGTSGCRFFDTLCIFTESSASYLVQYRHDPEISGKANCPISGREI